jgi:small subunit ribosomal protein S11
MAYKKKQRLVNSGIVNIKITLNNTIVSLSDKFGKILCWDSGGTLDYGGSKKNTQLIAQIIAKNVALKAKKFKIKILTIIIKGTEKVSGNGYENVLRTFKRLGFYIHSIHEQILLPHNGCRPPKKRSL